MHILCYLCEIRQLIPRRICWYVSKVSDIAMIEEVLYYTVLLDMDYLHTKYISISLYYNIHKVEYQTHNFERIFIRFFILFHLFLLPCHVYIGMYAWQNTHYICYSCCFITIIIIILKKKEKLVTHKITTSCTVFI